MPSLLPLSVFVFVSVFAFACASTFVSASLHYFSVMADYDAPVDFGAAEENNGVPNNFNAVFSAGCYSNYWQVAPIIRPYNPNHGLFPPLLKFNLKTLPVWKIPLRLQTRQPLSINEPTGPSLYDLVHPTFEESPNQYALEPHLLVQFLSSIIRNIGPAFHGDVDHPCPHFYWMQHQGNWYSFFHHFNSLNWDCVSKHAIELHRDWQAPEAQYDRYLVL